MAVATARRAWEFPSSSSDKTYTAQLAETGLVSCNCKGWTIKKLDQPRECKHTRAVIAVLADDGYRTFVRDGNWFAMKDGEPSGTARLAEKVKNKVLEDPTSPFQPLVRPVTPGAFIPPMLAQDIPEGKTVEDYGDEWVLQEKFDGVRMGVTVRDGVTKAWSRLENTRSLPTQIDAALREFPDGYYDGELWIPGGASWDVAAGVNSGKEVLVVFDLLNLMGKNTMGLPYRDRHALLEELFKRTESKHVILPPFLVPKTNAMLEGLWKQGREGVMVKNLGALYRPKHRSDQWLKVKAEREITLELYGYEAGKTGEHAVGLLRGMAPVKNRMQLVHGKTKLKSALHALVEKDPDRYIGTRIECLYQLITPGGSFRHLRMVRVAGPHE